MTMTSLARSPGANPLQRIVETAIRLFSAIPIWIVTLIARFSLAAVFWMSGRTKVAEGTLISLSDSNGIAFVLTGLLLTGFALMFGLVHSERR